MQIPNLCKNSVLLLIILYTQLFAVFLFLVVEQAWRLEYLGYYSIYLQWCVLGSVALLCYFRRTLNSVPARYRPYLSAFLCFGVFLLVELAAQQLRVRFLPNAPSDDLLKVCLAAVIAIFMVHRFIHLFSLSEQRDKAEAQARIEALQARIRPHFLFNSLNTISELAATQPQQAEQAISDLALLFRASLESISKSHSLEAELNLCRRYVELERWRLAEKLTVTWQVVIAQPLTWQVPKLILQPLIENAILHGKQSNGRVDIQVDVKETKQHLSIMVENIKGEQTEREGNGIAVDNIKERLFMLYDDQQSFRVRDEPNLYQVIMRFPKQSTQRLGD